MISVLSVVGPIFALVALGYVSVRLRLFPAEGVSGLISFVNNFATPCLLFQAMLTVDFSTAFNPRYLLSFYIGAFACFFVGFLIARYVFRRRAGESVAVAFSAYFTNTILLGLPIIQRAYGDEALPYLFAIVGFHAPILMSFGMLVMEFARRDGAPMKAALIQSLSKVVRNPLLIGITLGITANLSGIDLPEVVDVATQMMATAVLPAALFGLGGALNQYKLRESWQQALVSSLLKLCLHPAIALVLCHYVFGLPWEMTRVAVLTAAMPSGLNVYIFATFYNRSTDIAANTILQSTVLGVVTISTWLLLLEYLAARL
ncbi:AEC family transporter [Sneathiella chinensis]|uniref:Malonate transporter n=1 Tax=Sneathiella chinensis TaxID=349750 RepID=A0ABQ5U029_9PROT|nr:AEC family transporter [Sneathiella chinensis]GLQ05183.1 malonate transporter [Sneathiella chinensis]